MERSTRIRVLVADDEPLARAKLADMLAGHRDVEVVGECRDGLEVVTAVAELAPDLVLLDIQMPGMSGLEALRAIGPDRMPVTIFLTAYSQFAVEAFECQALDYVLKPFDQDRLDEALARARNTLALRSRTGYEAELRGLLSQLARSAPPVQRFLVRKGADYQFVRTAEIDWIQSSDNYVTLHCGPRQFMLRETLTAVEEQLDPQQFLRVRASAIVNLERVALIRPWSGTEFQFVLHDDTTVLSTRRFRDRIRSIIP